jgi:hypothetical protein
MKLPRWIGGLGFIIVAAPIVVWALRVLKAGGGMGAAWLMPAMLALLALNAFFWLAVTKRT